MFKKKVEKKSKFHKCSKCGMETTLFSCPNCKVVTVTNEKEVDQAIKDTLTNAEKRKLRRLKRKKIC